MTKEKLRRKIYDQRPRLHRSCHRRRKMFFFVLLLPFDLANFLNLSISFDEAPNGVTGGHIDRTSTNETLRASTRKHCAKPSRCVKSAAWYLVVVS